MTRKECNEKVEAAVGLTLLSVICALVIFSFGFIIGRYY